MPSEKLRHEPWKSPTLSDSWIMLEVLTVLADLSDARLVSSACEISRMLSLALVVFSGGFSLGTGGGLSRLAGGEVLGAAVEGVGVA